MKGRLPAGAVNAASMQGAPGLVTAPPFAMMELATGGQLLVLWSNVTALVDRGKLLDGPHKDKPAVAVLVGARTLLMTGDIEALAWGFCRATGAIRLPSRSEDPLAPKHAIQMGYIAAMGDEAIGTGPGDGPSRIAAVLITRDGPEIRVGCRADEVFRIMNKPDLSIG